MLARLVFLICLSFIILLGAVEKAQFSSASIGEQRSLLSQLARTGDGDSIQQAVDLLLTHEQPNMLTHEIETLGKQPRIVECFEQLHTEASPSGRSTNSRQAALLLLAAAGDDRSIEECINALNEPALTESAAKALKKITKKSFGTDSTKWREWYNTQSTQAHMFLDDLAEAIDHEDTIALSKSMHRAFFCKVHRSEVAELLMPLLEDDDPSVVAMAYHGLKTVGGPVATLALEDVPRPRKTVETLIDEENDLEVEVVVPGPELPTLANPSAGTDLFGIFIIVFIILLIGFILYVVIKAKKDKPAAISCKPEESQDPWGL